LARRSGRLYNAYSLMGNILMNPLHPDEPTELHRTPPFLPVLLVLFGGSGCSALIYEIVWFQLLELVIGSSAVSLAVLLGTFMGGMCLGSVLLPRIISARRHPLRVYALLELGIGLIALVVLFGLPHADRLYAASLGQGLRGILLRGLVAAVCLLPPALLMGGTLPAIARWIATTRQGVSWLGFFYGANIAGAVFGCLLAGFYLLRVHDTATATVAAAAINGVVALIGLVLAARMPTGTPRDEATQDRAARGPDRWAVYVAIALSGMTALGAEVVWTRLLSLLLGGTVYTFSIILAVFLAGLGLGSSAGSFLARTAGRPRMLLGGCQLLLTAAVAWTAYMLTQSLPYWPINTALSTSPWFTFQLDLMRCIWAILPATLLWGASFPLALASAASPGQDPARLVGGVYAANTIGAIAGAIGSSLLVIPWLGTQQAQRLLIGLSTAAAILMLAPLPWMAGEQSPTDRPKRWTRRLVRPAVWAASLSIAAGLAWSVAAVPGELVAYGRYLLSWTGQAEVLYVGEGMNSSVAVSLLNNNTRNFHVSGKVEASTEQQDMRLQRMLGHLSALLHRRPRSVLVVGCGAGVTAGSFVPYPEVERIVICEIEPLIPQVVATFFAQENFDVVHDPRVEVVYDDARHFILTTREKFDVITSDPIHPWVKGAATLYTKEYFELCKQHLNPGGLVTQWVPLYESDDATVKSEIATFFDAFPNGTIWSNNVNGQGYDIVLAGWPEPAPIHVDALQQRLDRKDHAQVVQSLEEVGFKEAIALLATYGGRATDLKPWLEGAEINRDHNLRLQYLAGMGVNTNRSAAIYDEMAVYRTYPDDLFIASGRLKQALRQRMQPAPAKP
jgi:spermidine synthase